MPTNKLNKEEQALRDKLNQATFSYDASDWQDVKSKMNTTPPKALTTNVLLKGAAMLLIVVGSVLALQYMYNQDGIFIDLENNEVNTEEEQKVNSFETVIEESTNNNVVEQNESVENNLEQNQQITHEENYKSEEFVKDENNKIVDKVNEPEGYTVKEDESLTHKNKTTIVEKSYTSFIRIKGERCLGNTIELRADCDAKGRELVYHWKVNGKKIAKQTQKIQLLLDQEGDYKINLQITDKEGNILSEIENTFEVLPFDNLDFTYINHQGILNDFEVDFDYEKNLKNISWSIDNKEITLKENTTYDFRKAGLYDVKMRQTNQDGCILELEKPVVVEANFVPLINAFTPNGDGINDEFIPIGFEDFDGQFRFVVYESSGAVVYETNDPKKPWNGKRNNTGNLMPEGNYVWKVEVRKAEQQRIFTDRVKLLNIK